LVPLFAGFLIMAIAFIAISYIVRQKRSGAKCIGCAHSKTCGTCGCGCGEDK